MENTSVTKIPGYRLHRKIGQGGMAVVYLATQESFDRKVALKIIANKAFGKKELAERFMREAKIVASLSHPHIVPVYDVGSIGNYQYLAMDYLQGGDLKTWIKAGLEPQESLQIIMQMAQALHFAHNKGYVHRDIKPGNIMFREDNSAVLTDFGIAKPLSSTETDMTQTGIVVGTPTYMSPEQSQGKDIDGRADLYSLGVLLFLMLSGDMPYTADDALSLAIKHINDPIPKLPQQVAKYQDIIDQLMAKDPADRFDSGLALCKAIAAVESVVETSPNTQASTDTTAEDIDDYNVNDLSIVTDKDESSENKNKHIQFKQSSFRKMGVIKKQCLECELHSEEYHHFSVLFSQFTTELLQWNDQYNKRCAKVILNLFIKPGIVDRAHDALKRLHDESEIFGFLDELEFTINIFEPKGKAISSFSLADA